jgi:hypothetical protein
MLIEFSVANFRSFRERQTLSMVAAPRLRKRENVFRPVLADEKFPELLKVAVIYGPNASGKSNLLKALTVIQLIAFREPSASEAGLPVGPFLFDPELADQPSLFEVHFIKDGIRYQFNLAATRERIVTERLSRFVKGREVLLYERQHTVDGDAYTFGPLATTTLEAPLLEAWKKLTPPKVLFIAQAVANSNEEIDVLRAPFTWLKHSSHSVLHGMGGMAASAQELARDDDIHADDIAAFLREVDVPISRIRVESNSATPPAVNSLIKTYRQASRTFLTHKTALGSGDLPYEDESEGTKNLIGFWLPWITREPRGIPNPRCLLIVDELDSSLHPKIVATLVEKHINSAMPSQLIFTTHDTHLMDVKLLRRDQIWITERDMNGATILRSIHDFEGREGEDIEKRYYEGRYRGLPLVKQK